MRADGGESDSDSDVAFALMDFSGVNFDSNEDTGLSDNDKIALDVEQTVLFSDIAKNIENAPDGIRELYELLSAGKYVEALMSAPGEAFFGSIASSEDKSMAETIRDRVYSFADNVSACVQVELLAVAAFNLFLQLNYTGPSLDRGTSPMDVTATEPLARINPHECFQSQFSPTMYASEKETKEFSTLAPKRDKTFHNKVLSEMAVDGEWPCQVCQVPYLLLVARSLLFTLACPQRKDWTNAVGSAVRETELLTETVSHSYCRLVKNLKAVHLWSARAAVAHERLLQAREPSVTLWEELNENFQFALALYCEKVDTEANYSSSMKQRRHASIVVLEWGLAHHHFNRPGQGKLYFCKAKEYSGLKAEVTGAVGKRTKFQQESTAQMVVRATSINETEASHEIKRSEKQEDPIKAQMIEHGEDGLLLERIKFDEEKENKVTRLSTLDQSILLSLCLDVKNSNPTDGLTAEQMGAYLARVLDQHDDWMVYSTALLERAWLECERTHGRERAILQIQALADQHTNRLTITQSTFESIEDSAPPQERLRNLHSIVYPPRWAILQDLAERYAKIGIVTSAAELFEEVELWDGVVECYRHAGKLQKAEQIVRTRLDEAETPRMWAALGDLTNDPSHYHKALELSNGRFSDANVALGKYFFDRGELEQAAEYYQKALKIRPLMSNVWFRLGAISMQLGNWKTALNAFTEVVQQEPEEAEAWANAAAVHMHNRMPAQAYLALNEALKHNRNNWRVWISKLYTCIDLKKYDEAIQACNVIIDFKSKKNTSEAIPALEEKCVRAIVGGSIEAYKESSGDHAAMDSSRRTLFRVHDLLDRLGSSTKTEPWIWETLAYLNAQVGRDEQILENLMKEYRSLQAIRGWEKDSVQVKKVSQVVNFIVQIQKDNGSKESLVKCKLLLSGVVKKIRAVHLDESTLPEEVEMLEQLVSELESQLTATD